MTLETKDELLLTMLFLGFRLFVGSLLSLPFIMASAGLPSPNAGRAGDNDLRVSVRFKAEPFSLPASSCMLCGMPERVLLDVAMR